MFKIQASSSLKGWFLGESEAHSALLKPCLVPLKGAPLPPATWLQSQGRWPPYESRIRDRLVELPPSGMFPVGSPPGDIIFIQRWLARSTHTQMCVHTYHSCVSILCIHSMHIYTYIHAHTHYTYRAHNNSLFRWASLVPYLRKSDQVKVHPLQGHNMTAHDMPMSKTTHTQCQNIFRVLHFNAQARNPVSPLSLCQPLSSPLMTSLPHSLASSRMKHACISQVAYTVKLTCPETNCIPLFRLCKQLEGKNYFFCCKRVSHIWQSQYIIFEQLNTWISIIKEKI